MLTALVEREISLQNRRIIRESFVAIVYPPFSSKLSQELLFLFFFLEIETSLKIHFVSEMKSNFKIYFFSPSLIKKFAEKLCSIVQSVFLLIRVLYISTYFSKKKKKKEFLFSFLFGRIISFAVKAISFICVEYSPFSIVYYFPYLPFSLKRRARFVHLRPEIQHRQRLKEQE